MFRPPVRLCQLSSVVFSLAPLFFLAGRMAAHAVLEVLNPLLAVLSLDLEPLVFVAAIAGVGCQIVGVTGPARAGARLAVVDGEFV